VNAFSQQISQGLREWFEAARDRVGGKLSNVARGTFTLALFLGGAYLVDARQNTYIGLFLVGWSFGRASTYMLTLYRLSVGRALLGVVADTRCNTTIELYVAVNEVLNHSTVAAAFERLKTSSRIDPDVAFENWRDSAVERYRMRDKVPTEGREYEHVVFNIRAGQLWKNLELQRLPVILHELLIPDESLKKTAGFFRADEKYDGLKIRLLVINGVLKLQVGNWSEEETGHREPGQSQGHWIAWDTVTTFPLLLNPLDHYLPPRFLLLDFFSSSTRSKRRSKEKRAFFRYADDYYRALGTWGEYGEERLKDRQGRQFEKWLESEGFHRVWEQPSWSNRFMRIELNRVHVDYETYKWLSDEGERFYG
jgi:hypothetical protein